MSVAESVSLLLRILYYTFTLSASFRIMCNLKHPEMRILYDDDGKTSLAEFAAGVQVRKHLATPSISALQRRDQDARFLLMKMDDISSMCSLPSSPLGYKKFDGNQLKGAFMAEFLGGVAKVKVPILCKARGILHLSRSHGSIILLN